MEIAIPNTPQHFRTAKLLLYLINVIIAVLIFFLALFVFAGIWVHVDPAVVEGFKDALADKPGQAPSISGLLTGGGIGGIIILAAYLYVAFVVRAIVKTTVNGNPFVDTNISRLRKTWIVIILAELVRMVAMGIVQESSVTGTTLESFGVETRLQAWILALFIAIMAEVFRIGLELRRDQELTV